MCSMELEDLISEVLVLSISTCKIYWVLTNVIRFCANMEIVNFQHLVILYCICRIEV